MISIDNVLEHCKEFSKAGDESAALQEYDRAICQYNKALRLLCTPELRAEVIASEEAQELLAATLGKLFSLQKGQFRELFPELRRGGFFDYLAATA